MMRRLLIRWAILSVAIGVTAAILDSVDVRGGLLGLIWVAALFGLVNAVIGTILRILSLPLTILTLGLFALVLNGVLLAITAGISDVLSVGGFWSTVWAALLISIFSTLLSLVLERATDQ